MLERFDTSVTTCNPCQAAFRGLHLALYEEAARALRDHFGPRGIDPVVVDEELPDAFRHQRGHA